jgi:hypothetical protein
LFPILPILKAMAVMGVFQHSIAYAQPLYISMRYGIYVLLVFYLVRGLFEAFEGHLRLGFKRGNHRRFGLDLP